MTAASVVIHDASGVDHTLAVQSDGNFQSSHSDVIAFPYSAKVIYQGKTRAMLATQTSGDCNSCHTATGANGAPGRVALPE